MKNLFKKKLNFKKLFGVRNYNLQLNDLDEDNIEKTLITTSLNEQIKSFDSKIGTEHLKELSNLGWKVKEKENWEDFNN